MTRGTVAPAEPRRLRGYIFLLALSFGLLVPGARAQDPVEATPEGPAEATTEELMEVFGWVIGKERGLEIGYTDEELQRIVNGMVRAAKGKPAPENLDALVPQLQAMLAERLENYQAANEISDKEAAVGHRAMGRKFLAEIASTSGVSETESGLYYKILEEGIGRHPSGNDIVRINYKGMLVDGTVFDSTERLGGPIDFTMRDVIPGFREGLGLAREGGKIKLFIPPDLAYGDESKGIIPPGSTLVFEIEILELNPFDELPNRGS